MREKYNIFMVVHWLLVVIFDHTKYENVPKTMMNMICHSDLMCYPRENKYCVCKTCNHSLKCENLLVL